MSPAEKEIQARAIDFSERLLKHAAAALDLHLPHPLCKKNVTLNMGGVKKKCVFHIVLPGVLRVYDAETNELLTESAPGQLDRLARRYTMGRQ